MHLILSYKLDELDFDCDRFKNLFKKQCNNVDDNNLTVLMILCWYNPQLLKYEWASKLVKQQSEKVDIFGYTALMYLFNGYNENIEFSSIGFKLLWEKEKDINTDFLKIWMCGKPELREAVVAAVPDAAPYYE